MFYDVVHHRFSILEEILASVQLDVNRYELPLYHVFPAVVFDFLRLYYPCTRQIAVEFYPAASDGNTWCEHSSVGHWADSADTEAA